MCFSSSDPADPRLIQNLSARPSYEVQQLSLDEYGRPLNPRGRTGLCGRGKLYMWGPNHAADPLVTREKSGEFQVILIKRGDTGSWALPGGMVDAGEEPRVTAAREFSEEALAHTDEQSKIKCDQLIRKMFHSDQPQCIYSGYIDDPRNTDNAVRTHSHCTVLL